MQPSITDWIQAIATAITALGIILVWWQVKTDHERSRRQNALALMQEWTKHLLQQRPSAIHLAKTLNKEQSQALEKRQPFSIAAKHENLVKSCLAGYGVGDNTLKVENGLISLDEQQATIIRWQVINYLNMLECVLAAWRHNMADKDMLKEQFRYLISPTEGEYLLADFREATGTKNYPSIHEFIKELRDEATSVGGGKSRPA